MYSGKPPLQTFAYGGNRVNSGLPLKYSAFAALHERMATSENCDPNLSVERKAAQKAESSASLEENHKSASVGAVSQLPKPETGVTRAISEPAGDSEGHSKEVNRSAKSLTTPTKVSTSPHHHSHGHRQHFCRSPRCASNNPDYAVPTQTTPRKYLISKRHLLPGAICTRDPATLASQIQDSAGQAPSTGKPPKPTRKLENLFRQPSFSEVKEYTNSPKVVESPATRIPKPPAAKYEQKKSLTSLEQPSLVLEQPRIDSTSEACLPSNLEPLEQCPANGSSKQETGEANFAGTHEANSDPLPSVDCCDIATPDVIAPSSCRASEARKSSEDLEKANESESSTLKVTTLSSLEKMFLPDFSRLPSGSSNGCLDSGPASPIHSSGDLEDVAEKLKLKLKLAFENAEHTTQEVTNCDSLEVAPNAGIRTSPNEPEETASMSAHEEADQTASGRTEGQLVEGSEDGEDCRFQGEAQVCDSVEDVEEGEEEGSKPFRGRSIASFIENYERSHNHPFDSGQGQSDVTKFVRGKGRQLWRSDCRDSREVVFLKQTSPRNRRAGDWMVDNILEGAISKLNPSGQGRVRVLVEAFESLMTMGDSPMPERRASRVWCLNRMEKGEVDEDGEEFEDGDQRVDCYEVSRDGLQLRASMRLSLGGGNRHAVCSPDEASEIEMSAIQKVQEWDDHRSTNFENSFEEQDHSCIRSQSSFGDEVDGGQDDKKEDQRQHSELRIEEYQRRMSNVGSSQWHANPSKDDRFVEEFNYNGRTVRQFSCSTNNDGKQRTQDLEMHYKHQVPRQRRFWKANSVKSESEVPCSSDDGNTDKSQRHIKATLSEPFRLLTEERGAIKEYQFAKKLEQILAEEERLRNPIAQGLPWTTDEPQVVPKPPVKEQTRAVEFRHYSNSRAIERAEFDHYVSERMAYVEMQRQEEERLRQLAEEEDIKRLRREMVPRAQLMPFFDQPFMPTRSSKRLTVPKEPSFHNREHKRAKCMVWQESTSQV